MLCDTCKRREAEFPTCNGTGICSFCHERQTEAQDAEYGHAYMNDPDHRKPVVVRGFTWPMYTYVSINEQTYEGPQTWLRIYKGEEIVAEFGECMSDENILDMFIGNFDPAGHPEEAKFRTACYSPYCKGEIKEFVKEEVSFLGGRKGSGYCLYCGCAPEMYNDKGELNVD